MRRILIIGATSAIAEATAREFAARGDALCLVGRDAGRLAAIAADLGVRGAVRTATATLDVTDFSAHAGVIELAERELGGLDTLLIAHGTLTDQADAETSIDSLTIAFRAWSRSKRRRSGSGRASGGRFATGLSGFIGRRFSPAS